jgi:hypothetical protein
VNDHGIRTAKSAGVLNFALLQSGDELEAWSGLGNGLGPESHTGGNRLCLAG